jgi:DNA-binding ferritin-like protein
VTPEHKALCERLLDLHKQATVERSHYYTGKCVREALEAIESLSAERASARRDADYYKCRLTEIMPLFQDARDAITAIPRHSAKLHRIDLNLADKMDAAGTRTREQNTTPPSRASRGANMRRIKHYPSVSETHRCLRKDDLRDLLRVARAAEENVNGQAGISELRAAIDALNKPKGKR